MSFIDKNIKLKRFQFQTVTYHVVCQITIVQKPAPSIGNDKSIPRTFSPSIMAFYQDFLLAQDTVPWVATSDCIHIVY